MVRLLALLVALSGFCGLTWEVLWQHHASLAIGVSARGTAIALAATMGGMGLGSWLMGRALHERAVRRPLLAYAALEVAVGLGGLTLEPAFRALGALDVHLYRSAPALANLGQVAGIAALLAPQVLAMGATVPVFRLIAGERGLRVSSLYGANTAGAAVGVLVAAGALIPALGMTGTAWVVSGANFVVALTAAMLAQRTPAPTAAPDETRVPATLELTASEQAVVVAATGFVTLLLEVAWFRSLRAAFLSTTDAFALMLVSVLVPLALGARLARRLPATRAAIGYVLAAAGVLATLFTPVIERFDLMLPVSAPWYTMQAARLGLSLVFVGLPVVPLGTVLPLLLDHTRSPLPVGRLYGLNTAASVLGALGGAWLLLPAVGFARTAWAGGLLLVGCALGLLRPRRERVLVLGAGAVALLVAALGESGVGRLRAQGNHLAGERHQVLFSREAPDATVSVIARADGNRELIIDGFQTSVSAAYGHYLDWMGHLPMALHPDPRRALVICFGTGRTSYAVAQERPDALDIVELSPAVLAAAAHFPASGTVISNPRAHVIVMDGRAWMRRTTASYDVITLEPMPPYFSGANSLYDVEFYRLASERLRPGGVIAQWLPLHLMTPADGASIVRTMQEVFPDTRVWIDPVDRTGILIGRRGGASGAPPAPPQVYDRPWAGRNLDVATIRRNLLLDPEASRRFGGYGTVITDDNQLLAYGDGRQRMQDQNYSHRSHLATLDIVFAIARGRPVEPLGGVIPRAARTDDPGPSR